MQIEKEHFLDASEPDSEGFYDYYYEGDVYRVSVGARTFKCRSYTDAPVQLSFLSYDNDQLFAAIPYDDAAFAECIHHFSKELGFRDFLVLTSDHADGPYTTVDLNRITLA